MSSGRQGETAGVEGETAGVGVVLGQDAVGVVIQDVLSSGGASMVERFPPHETYLVLALTLYYQHRLLLVLIYCFRGPQLRRPLFRHFHRHFPPFPAVSRRFPLSRSL